MEHEHVNEVRELKIRIEELEKQQKYLQALKYLKDTYLVDKLKDKIECPVCMEIPRKGPVPVCPNGHFVCPKCKKESCPTCRSIMGNNMSILAGTIIDNIEHQCKFEDCDQSFLLTDLEKHEEACPHRTVFCLHPSCTKEIPLSKLQNHLVDKTSCLGENVFVDLRNKKRCTSFHIFNGDVTDPKMTWGLDTFSFEGMDLALYLHKSQGQFYFVIVMFGTEVQCSEYRVELEVHEYSSNKSSEIKQISYKFCGNPTSIDVGKTKLNTFGINELAMQQMVDKSEDKSPTFSLSYRIVKK